MLGFVHQLLILLIFWLAAHVTQAQVVGELVSAKEGAQPGSRTTVALKLTHDPGWHTYWVSPGIGEATSIDRTLPDDWIASDFDWPVPVKIYTEAGVLMYLYFPPGSTADEGQLLPQILTPGLLADTVSNPNRLAEN